MSNLLVSELYHTSEKFQHFFGFHDICPWSLDDKKIIIHRVGLDTPVKMPDPGQIVEIVVWEPVENKYTKIGESETWNWQQGTRAQWLDNERVIFNLDINGKLKSKIININTNIEEIIPFPVYSISKDRKFFCFNNLARLNTYWPAYGYHSSLFDDENEKSPKSEAIYLYDLEKKEVTNIINLEEILDKEKSNFAAGTGHFFSHPTFSPSGKKICFYHRFFSKDNALFSNFYVINTETKKLTLVAKEKVSHFDWLNDDQIVVWTRFLPKGVANARSSGLLRNPFIRPLIKLVRSFSPGLKQSMLNEAYFKIDVNTGEILGNIGKGSLEQDGHPMFNFNRTLMLTDTYADHNTRIRKLIIYNMVEKKRYDVASLDSPIKFGDRDMKCDLHPRWNRDYTKICIDSTHTGNRQVHIYDAANFVGK